MEFQITKENYIDLYLNSDHYVKMESGGKVFFREVMDLLKEKFTKELSKRSEIVVNNWHFPDTVLSFHTSLKLQGTLLLDPIIKYDNSPFNYIIKEVTSIFVLGSDGEDVYLELDFYKDVHKIMTEDFIKIPELKINYKNNSGPKSIDKELYVVFIKKVFVSSLVKVMFNYIDKINEVLKLKKKKKDVLRENYLYSNNVLNEFILLRRDLLNDFKDVKVNFKVSDGYNENLSIYNLSILKHKNSSELIDTYFVFYLLDNGDLFLKYACICKEYLTLHLIMDNVEKINIFKDYVYKIYKLIKAQNNSEYIYNSMLEMVEKLK